MVRKKTTDQTIISMTLKLAENVPWNEITIDGIAQATKIKSSALIKIFPSKLSILDAFNSQVDAEIIEEFSNIKKFEPKRDQLFDILMARFDVLNRHKTAIKLIYKTTVPFDLPASAQGLENLTKSMKVVLNIADIPTSTILGCIKIKILSVIFFRSFVAWLDDESLDMAKTMAMLDGDLTKVEDFSSGISNMSKYER